MSVRPVALKPATRIRERSNGEWRLLPLLGVLIAALVVEPQARGVDAVELPSMAEVTPDANKRYLLRNGPLLFATCRRQFRVSA